jgi:hypothetical protein
VAAGSLDPGDHLSDVLERALPAVVEAVVAVISGRAPA